MDIKDITIEEIFADDSIQMRVVMSEETIDDYVTVLDDLPPVDVYQIDGKYKVADGFHRLAAYIKSVRKTIPCIIHQGTLEDAQEFACCANKAHGLRRTDGDKRKAVKVFFSIPGRDKVTNSEAARRLGVSMPFVQKVREDLGVKASPASHHGAGSERYKSSNNVIPNKTISSRKERLNDLIPLSQDTDKKVTNIDLPAENPHDFAVALLEYFDLDYLKSCIQELNDIIKEKNSHSQKSSRRNSKRNPTLPLT